MTRSTETTPAARTGLGHTPGAPATPRFGGMWVAAISGSLLLGLMWLASLPIATNPFLDDHLVYALVLLGLAATGAGLRYSLAGWWQNPAVRQNNWLR